MALDPVSATWKFYVDWTNSGLFDGAYDDITAYVLNRFIFQRGRDYGSQLKGRSIAGQAVLSLKNTDGRFNRFYTSSPLYGSLLPGRRVKITATYDGSTYTMFYGRLDSITTQTALGGFHTATLRALGQLALLEQSNVNIAMQTDIGTGAAVTAILDKVGWSAGERTLDTGQTTMNYFWTGGKVSALFGIRKVEDTESGYIGESADGKIVFEDRHHRIKGAHLVSQGTFSDADGSVIGYAGIDTGDPLKQVFNEFRCIIREMLNYETTRDSRLDAAWTMFGETPSVPAGGSIIRWANYPNELSVNLVAVSKWYDPRLGTDLIANSKEDGTGTDLSANFSVGLSGFDTTCKITVTNNGSVSAYITRLDMYCDYIYFRDSSTAAAEDSASQAKYGVRTFPHPSEFVPTYAEGESWANFNLGIYKEPLPVVTISFVANRNDDLMVQALSRDISDRITIVSNDKTYLGLNGDYFIESISHRVDDLGLFHVCTFSCSPADAWAGFWVLGTSTLGVDTKLAY